MFTALLSAGARPAAANQPSYSHLAEPDDGPVGEPVWLPFGLLDRMRLAPFHMSATTELGTHDTGDGTASLTLHAQMSTECSCNIGVYVTLPTSIAGSTDDSRQYQLQGAAGAVVMPPSSEPPRTQLGTMDVGLFGGTRPRREGWPFDTSWIYRVGALLPTGSREPHPWLPSARVGDRVLELPRSAGARLSTSKLYGWWDPPCIRRDLFLALRFDAGIDVASVLALPGNPVHVIPRAGLGVMASRGGDLTYSVDTALSLDPFVDGGRTANLRWSSGVTARYARADGKRSVVQPALTLAAVRTPEGWGASLLFDITASVSPHSSSNYD